MLKKVLIANRGEIARRIIRTANKMGIATVAVYSDADAKAMHVADADEAVHIGPSPATESYLVIDKIIQAAKQTGADAIHPGYGFLSENPDLPEACVKAGIIFIGPSAKAMRALGGKAAAKEIAIKAGVPVVPGYQGGKQDAKSLAKEAARIGYPVMIKAVAGGGGRGMRLVEKEADLAELLDSAQREAKSAFGNPDVLIEKVVVAPRHIEVQVFGGRHGNVVHMFERDCTLQRRNQKVIEEAPAPGMSAALRAKMCDAAVKLAQSVGYEGAGTVEFLVEGGKLSADAPWYFIEMNTRLQVEHPVTEEITGLDLVEWQFRVAAGEKLPVPQSEIKMSGHAIEVRLCAEDPAKGFMPSVGRIVHFGYRHGDVGPGDVRLETGVAAGSEISPYYDSMVAKLIAARSERGEALDALIEALRELPVTGIKTNAEFLSRLMAHDDVRSGKMDTGLIARNVEQLASFDIDLSGLDAGIGMLMIQRAAVAWKFANADARSSWADLSGFNLGPKRQLKVMLSVDGSPHDFDVEWTGDGSIKLLNHPPRNSASAEPLLADSHTNRERIFVRFGCVPVELAWPTYDASELDDGNGGAAIRAPINGRVAKLFVAAGATVEKGQRIAIVEAMKMEHVLSAGTSGTIDKIAVEEGAQVTQGTLIASIAEAG